MEVIIGLLEEKVNMPIKPSRVKVSESLAARQKKKVAASLGNCG